MGNENISSDVIPETAKQLSGIRYFNQSLDSGFGFQPPRNDCFSLMTGNKRQ